VAAAAADMPFRHTKPEAVVSRLYSYQLESLTWMTVPLPNYARMHDSACDAFLR
jgi:hypothetical protein